MDQGTPITTEMLLQIIGKLHVQIDILQEMLRATKGQSEIPNSNHEERQESKVSL